MVASVTEKIKDFFLNFSVAGISSILAKTIAAPIERTKLILQNQDSALHVLEGKAQKCNGIIDCLMRITKEQGFFSLYRGNTTNIVRYFPMQALNFAFNDQFNSVFVSFIGTESLPKRFLVKSLSGGSAGALTVTILFPLEFCLTRIAVDMGGGKTKGLEREFNGLRDCVTKVIRKDGYKGFYYGYRMSATGVALYRSLYFGLYDSVMFIWKTYTLVPSVSASHPILLKLCLAQGVTIAASLSVYPLDTASRRKMLDSGRPEHLRLFKDNRDVYRTIYQKEGIRGFYKGGLANCVRGLSGAIVLVMYDEIMHYVKVKKWVTGCDNC